MAEASSASTWMSRELRGLGQLRERAAQRKQRRNQSQVLRRPAVGDEIRLRRTDPLSRVISRTRAFENTGGKLAVSAEAAASSTLPSFTMRYGSHMSGTSVLGSGKPLRLSRFVNISRPPARLAYGRDWLTQDWPGAATRPASISESLYGCPLIAVLRISFGSCNFANVSTSVNSPREGAPLQAFLQQHAQRSTARDAQFARAFEHVLDVGLRHRATYFIHGPGFSADSSRGFAVRKVSKRLANTAADTPPPDTPLSSTMSRARLIWPMPSSATAVYTAARVPPPEAATMIDGRCSADCASRRCASVSPRLPAPAPGARPSSPPPA